MNDDQFSVIRQSALRDTLTALFGALIILWLALRSWKIVAAVFFSPIVGVAGAPAVPLPVVRAFNLISISLFFLFLGPWVYFSLPFTFLYPSPPHNPHEL